MPAKKNGAKYEVDQGLSKVQRAAHFLNWSALHHPGTYVPFNELLRSIQGYERKPQLKSEEVEHLRKNGSAIKKALWENYKREVISLPGVGIRASTDDADVLTNVVPKRASRLQSAKNNFVKSVTNIDPTKIPNTPALKPHKDWLQKEIKDLVKQIGSAEFERKLLPPAIETTPVPQE
jgi:hypothetical protein